MKHVAVCFLLTNTHYIFKAYRATDYESVGRQFESALGRAEEALPHMELALELDPLNPMYHAFYGVVLLYHRRSDDALAAFHTALDIEPNQMLALSSFAKTFGIKGMHDEQPALSRNAPI
jgi:tetratricopeptide (TPR) repeat protein